MARTIEEQMKTLDSYQRAQFIFMHKKREACNGAIAALREKTFSTHKELEKINALNDRLWLIFLIALSVFGLAQGIFEPFLRGESVTITVSICFAYALALAATDLRSNHLKTLFEMYVIEINRYQSELFSYGLSDIPRTEEDGNREILSSLGFDDGLIGSFLRTRPLEPQA